MENETLIHETNELLSSFNDSLIDCLWSSKKLLHQLKNNELSSYFGISIMELKNRMFLNYLIDIVGIMKHKLLGEEDNNTIERLVEERIVLEKIRPIEEKLKYQVDMLMKTLNTGVIESNNPLNCKPDFSFVMEEPEEIDQNSDRTRKEGDSTKMEDSVESKIKNKIYVPPRLAQMKYEEEQEKRAKHLERAKKRAINTSIINELRKELDDAPEEEYVKAINQKAGIEKFMKRKKKYEEENFIRLNLTKKQKAQARKLSTINSIADDITRFEDISVLNIDNSSDFVPTKKKSKKFKTNKKRKFKKR